jgi:hypothetical protein
MTRLLVTVLIIGGVAAGIPFVLLRRTGVGRIVYAYTMGFLISSLTSIGLFLTTRAVLPAPPFDADGIIGSGLLCAVIGPVLGVLAAKRFRPRIQ